MCTGRLVGRATRFGGQRGVAGGHRQLLIQARALADTEEALVRLAAGHFGRCEHCAAPIPPAQLELEPEARYCPRCAPA